MRKYKKSKKEDWQHSQLLPQHIDTIIKKGCRFGNTTDGHSNRFGEFDESSRYYFNRVDSHLASRAKYRIMAIYKKGVQSVAGYTVRARQDKDGYKFFIDRGWVLVRASGTEPLIRFYAEADTPAKVDELLAAVVKPK
ncbi:MAG: hypothetical protein ABSB78_07680 [Bacteroidota bacterium]